MSGFWGTFSKTETEIILWVKPCEMLQIILCVYNIFFLLRKFLFLISILQKEKPISNATEITTEWLQHED